MAMARIGLELRTNLDSVSTSTNQITNRGWTHSSVLLILLLCAFSPRILAQSLPPTTADDQAGEQAYMSYHGGDIDSVGLTNGTLSLNFPFLSYPQRGKLHLSFNLMYHNGPQHQGQFCTTVNGKQTCNWMWGYGAVCCALGVNWAQTFTVHGQSQVVMVEQTTEYYGNFALQMPDGSRHPLGNLGTFSLTPPNSPGCGSGQGTFQCEIQNGPLETLDATGWQVNGPLQAHSDLSLGYYIAPTSVVDPDGIIYGNGTIQDPNGNKITSNSGTITDSLGRQIPIPPTFLSTQVAPTNCPVVNGVSAAFATLWTNVPAYNGTTAQYTFCYANSLLQSIVLPNGQSWQFQYNDSDGTNAFTTLTQTTMPTGGTISYTYTYGGQYHNILVQDYGRWVATRTVNANDGTGSHTWTYTYNNPDIVGGTTTVTDPLGNDVVHTFGFGNTYATYETQTQYYQGSHSSGTLLKTVNTAYSSLSGGWNSAAPTSVVPTNVTTVWGNGQTSEVTKAYDSGYSFTDYYHNSGKSGIYGKVVTEKAYDYPSGTSLLRTTSTSYAWQSPNPNSSSYLANNLLNLPYSVTVTGAGGNSSYAYYLYDEGSLQASNISEQKVTGENYPGNQTSVHRQLNGNTTGTPNCPQVTTGYLVSTKVYYDTGEVQKSTDPCGIYSTYQYSSAYQGAFLTTATNILNQSTNYGYDFNTGAVTSIQDPNVQTTTKTYDSLTRLGLVSFPDGGLIQYCYTDSGGPGPNCTQSSAPPFSVVQTRAITSSKNEISTVVFDGLGRVSQTQLNSDPSGVDYGDTTYDANGRKSTVSNPHRSASSTTDGVTTNVYDALGRVTSVVEQDGSTVSTSYASFPCTTVTDESGKSRQSCVDGLGRMTSVIEDPGTTGHLNYSTTYAYDALGSLTAVTQNGSNSSTPRPRSFTYDSLSELTSATNPESGTISYNYDADGNVITRTAPSPNQPSNANPVKTVVTTYGYDTINRLTSKNYSDSYSSNPATHNALFAYDANALTGCSFTVPTNTDSYPVGRRTSMCDGSGATAWSHDKMGRILKERRTIASVSGDYDNDTYNLDGSVATVTALGYAVSYTYDTARRVLNVENSSDPFNFAVNATYAPPGEVASAQLGAAGAQITVTNAYNGRLQPILLSAATSSSTVFSECFDFHLGIAITTPSQCALSAYTTGDNGNVYTVANNRSGDSGRTQTFTYDSLNRIATGQSSGTQWGETFTIDAWGNMTNIGQVSGKTNHESLSQSALTNNQLTGFTYDAAGNMIVNSPATYFYDAENRLIATAGTSYIYDGDGNRVEKCTEESTPGVCASGATGTMYWRGTSSDPQAETDLSGNVLENYIFFNGRRIARREPTKAVHFYFSDQVGSHGVVTNASGTTCEQDIDYYPYGGQENDYCPNVAQHYKFNGKERDTESGLDNFGARYDNSALGRFMTPDWAAKPVTVPYAKFGDPQSLNLYSFTENGPINRIDPDGHTDYYDPSGKPLGNDGISNGAVVIQNASAVHYSPDHSVVDVASSGIPVYSFTQAEGNAIQASVDRTLAPAGGDHQGGFHEEGFTEDAGGIHVSAPGPAYQPGDSEAHITQTINNTTTMVEHTHPSGTQDSAGTTTFGGTHFDPKPSTGPGQDVPNARGQDNITHVEASAGNSTVYIYNDKGVQAHVPLSAFPKPKKLPQ